MSISIDTSKIDGYTDMSAEEKVAALEAFQLDDRSAELERYKSALTKSNSEAASWKRKHNELLSEEERKKAEQDEAFNSMQEELKALREEKAVNENVTKFIALGYDEQTAKDCGKALANGDFEKVFEAQKKFNENLEKKVKSDLLKGTPAPQSGATTKTMTKQEIMAIKDTAERQKAIAENIHLFK